MTFGSRLRRCPGVRESRLAFVAVLLVCSFLVSGPRTSVIAQDATPEASPAGEACAEVGGEAGSTPAASPVAEETEDGTLVEDQTVIETAANAVAETWGCTNAWGLMANFDAVDTVVSYADGSLGVEYSVRAGLQVEAYQDTIVDQGGTWSVTEREMISPSTDLDSLSVGLNFASEEEEFVFEIALPEFEATEATTFNVTNTGDFNHNFVLTSVPEGFDPAAAHFEIAAPAEGQVVLGGLYLEAGETGLALFEGLQPGAYAIYCVVEAQDGETHADKGMVASLTITEPIDLDIPDVVGTPAG